MVRRANSRKGKPYFTHQNVKCLNKMKVAFQLTVLIKKTDITFLFENKVKPHHSLCLDILYYRYSEETKVYTWYKLQMHLFEARDHGLMFHWQEFYVCLHIYVAILGI